MNPQLNRLMADVQARGVRLVQSWGEVVSDLDLTIRCFSVVTTRERPAPPVLTIIVTEFGDGGYELYTPGVTAKIADDVDRICGAAEQPLAVLDITNPISRAVRRARAAGRAPTPASVNGFTMAEATAGRPLREGE